jgi:two-component system, chemotaxis family, sensor kinase CheA
LEDDFKRMFFEEARELLLVLEQSLMELEQRQDERAHLDKTFRAAHSLKGGAAMVGLAAIAEFTHGMETVLDRVRSGSLAVDSDVISTLLEARDHLAAAVEGESAGRPIPAAPDLVNRLSALLRDRPPDRSAPPPPLAKPTSKPPPPAAPAGKDDAFPGPAEPPGPAQGSGSQSGKKPRSRSPRPRKPRPGKPKDDVAAQGQQGPSPGGFLYRITFAPGPDLMRRGINPLGVLDELRDLGTCRVSTDPDSVPPLEEFDPERCYFCWSIELETAATIERLDDVFLFVSDDSRVTIECRRPDGQFEVVRAPAAMPAMPVAAVPPRPSAEGAALVVAAATGGATKPPPGPAAKPGAMAISGPGPVLRPPARIRVDAQQLDDLVGFAGELAVLSDNLQGLASLGEAAPWIPTLEALDRVSRLIRDSTLELRMVPVEELFSRFPRVVRDLADRSGKEIELRMDGQDTRLDRTIVERLSEPMIHLIRNAVDHGLETPEERLAAGKPRAGQITLWAGHEGDRVALRVEEDGRGLDRDRIVRKGIAAGLVPVGTSTDDPRIDALIFEPGFSTRDEVSELSGRGVGLDVVRDAVRSLRGSLAVQSTPGKGTAFIFRLPLTLALIDGLLVDVAGLRYVVPLAQVEECVALNGHSAALSKGRPCVSVRGELVPMVLLRKLFRANDEAPPRQELLLTRHAGQRVGVAVDRLVGRVQAVIQSLGQGLHGLGRFSGATILADGSVSLILDLAALVNESRAADNQSSSHRFQAENLR